MTTFGVHTGLQDSTVAELVEFWRAVESFGYDWISIWDHFYSAEQTDKSNCFEAVAMHGLLASVTDRVRCGSLVYCVNYRHPAVLANAIATIDHISAGRVELGIGIGWHELEHAAYGLPFEPVGTRMRRLTEAVTCIRGLLTQETVDFAGEFYTLTSARCDPKPLQERLPIWIGGGGERRTLRQVAALGDGMNVGFISPGELRHKCSVLAEHCSEVGRAVSEIKVSVNLGLAWSKEDCAERFKHMPMATAGGILSGTEQEVFDRLSEYQDAGADHVNIAVRAPFPTDELRRLIPVVDEFRNKDV